MIALRTCYILPIWYAAVTCIKTDQLVIVWYSKYNESERNVTYCSKTDGDGNEQAWINWIITSELKHEDLIWLSCGPGGPWHDLDPSVLWMYNVDY